MSGKWVIIAALIVLIFSAGAIIGLKKFRPAAVPFVSPIGMSAEKPLAKYSIPRLASSQVPPGTITLDSVVATTSAYTEWLFHFIDDGKKVTGVAHIPNGTGPFPVIVQLRGFVAKEDYAPGVGTSHSAQVFAKNGFISLAPDFLGYGGSDMPSSVSIEERFQTYTTVLSLLSSIGSLPSADAGKVAIWGHSNGGQIALTTLAVTGKKYPTSLWAPVSKSFPFNILAYTDEFDDQGKALRKVVADFEKDYNADNYSFTNYLDRIQAPIILHQGDMDEEVPWWWSRDFTDAMQKLGKRITLYRYAGMNHNFDGGGWWDTVVERDINFFQKNFIK